MRAGTMRAGSRAPPLHSACRALRGKGDAAGSRGGGGSVCGGAGGRRLEEMGLEGGVRV